MVIFISTVAAAATFIPASPKTMKSEVYFSKKSSKIYADLWKEYREAQQKDLPQTARKVLDAIRQHALHDGNEGQLLAAVVSALEAAFVLDVDTARAELDYLLALAEPDLSKGAQPVGDAQIALRRAVAGMLACSLDADDADSLKSRGRELFRRALEEKEALHVARAADYLPFFKSGTAEPLERADLLSIIAAAALDNGNLLSNAEADSFLSDVVAFYENTGQSARAIRFELLRLEHNYSLTRQERLDSLTNLRKRYADSPAVAAVYVKLVEAFLHSSPNFYDVDDDGEPDMLEPDQRDSLAYTFAREGLEKFPKSVYANRFRNLLSEITQPKVSLDSNLPRPRTDCEAEGKLTVRNVRDVKVRVYRLELRADDERLDDFFVDGKDLRYPKVRRSLVGEFSKTFPADFPAWQTHGEILPLGAWSEVPGIYMTELTADGHQFDRDVVHVSHIFPLVTTAESGVARIRLLDANTGAPLPDASLTAFESNWRSEKYVRTKVKRYVPNADGAIEVPFEGWQQNDYRYFAEADGDAYLPSFPVRTYQRSEEARKNAEAKLKIFTDRAIYRPGQTVHFSGIAYTQTGDAAKADADYKTEVELHDANGQLVEKISCTSDAFGCISGSFSLPKNTLPGHFKICASSPRYALVNFRVEAYKRPTFTVTTEPVAAAYALGDTVQLEGRVASYTALPLAATVRYTVRRSSWFYNGNELAPQEGETTTDADGRFSIPVALTYDAERDATNGGAYNRFYFAVELEALAANGETVTAHHTVVAATLPAYISASLPDVVCREERHSARVVRLNPAGRELPGDIAFEVRAKTYEEASNAAPAGSEKLAAAPAAVLASGTFAAGNFDFDALTATLPSGEYEISLNTADAAPHKHEFTLFSENDERPVGKAVKFEYVRHSAAGDSALVLFGTPESDVTVFFEVFNNFRRFESRTFALSDSLLRLSLAYRDEMGDGATARFVFVRRGKIFSTAVKLQRPKPEQHLRLEWSTFRSALQAGQGETWRLRVLEPDGKPAAANVMARLYDASLDAFATNPWTFRLHFRRDIADGRLISGVRLPVRLWLDGSLPFASEKFAEPGYARFANESLVSGLMNGFLVLEATTVGGLDNRLKQPHGVRYSKSLSADAREESLGMSKTFAEAPAAAAALSTTAAAAPKAAEEAEPAVAATPAVRTNFSETAFFMPTLRTDQGGEVVIEFTLPESLTTWNFEALAHTRSLSNGVLTAQIVASKAFMVQPALPRFIRRGDKVDIPVSIRSAEKEKARAIAGRVRLELIDPASERIVHHAAAGFTLEPGGETTVHFAFEAGAALVGELPALRCRIVGEGGGFSDGEEHDLPVLSDRVSVSRSLPFVLRGVGTSQFALDSLWSGTERAENRRLTVEITSNPAWYAVAALPPLAESTGESAVSLAVRLYALSLAQSLAKRFPEMAELKAEGEAEGWAAVLERNPELKQTLLEESPWAGVAASEAERTRRLADLFNDELAALRAGSAVDKLAQLQGTDGGFAWYPGMRSSEWVTAEVAVLLARQKAYAAASASTEALSKVQRQVQAMLTSAVKFLDGRIAERVAEMKKEAAVANLVRNDELTLRYAYLRGLLGSKPTPDLLYLLAHAVKETHSLSIFGKARTALALQAAGRTAEAQTMLQSVREYTVESPEMGRFFSTSRAQLTDSYRLPTQCAAIEALLAMPTEETAQDVSEMRLWLMQTKRTTMWASDVAAADAVFALLSDGIGVSAGTTSLTASPESRALTAEPAAPVRFTLEKRRRILAANADSEAFGQHTAGYVCKAYTDAVAADIPVLEATNIKLRKTSGELSWGSVVAQFTVPLEDAPATSAGLAVERRWEVRRSADVWEPLAESVQFSVGDEVRQIVRLKAERDFDFVAIHAPRPACLAPRHPLSGFEWSPAVGSGKRESDNGSFRAWLYGPGLATYRAVRDASTAFFVDSCPKGTYEFVEAYFVDRAGSYQTGAVRAESVYAPEFSAQTSSAVIEAK